MSAVTATRRNDARHRRPGPGRRPLPDAYAPSSWTLPSHVSLLTSLSCFRHGVNRENDRMEETRDHDLADVLRLGGFLCAAVTGGGFLSPVFGFSKGFDVYRQAEDSPWTSDAAGQVAAAAWMDRGQPGQGLLPLRPYLSAPHPYIPPAPYDTMFQDVPTPLEDDRRRRAPGRPVGHLQDRSPRRSAGRSSASTTGRSGTRTTP